MRYGKNFYEEEKERLNKKVLFLCRILGLHYRRAIQPLSLDSQCAPPMILSTARITESPTDVRSHGPPFSDSNCNLTIIFHLLVN